MAYSKQQLKNMRGVIKRAKERGDTETVNRITKRIKDAGASTKGASSSYSDLTPSKSSITDLSKVGSNYVPKDFKPHEVIGSPEFKMDTSSLTGYAKYFGDSLNQGLSANQAHNYARSMAGPVLQQQLPQQQPQQQAYDIRAEIERLSNLKRKQAMAQLDKSRSAALSNLQQEQAGIAPQYYDLRNAAAVQNRLGAKSLQEYLANRGLRNSGENTQARLMQNASLQGQVGSLKRQEQQALEGIARRGTDIQNAYQSDLVGLEAGLGAQALQALINQRNLDRQYGVQVAGLTGDFQGTPTLAAQQFGLQAQGQQFNQDMTTRQFEYQQARDAIADERYKMEFDEDVRRFGLNYALDKARINNQISGGGSTGGPTSTQTRNSYRDAYQDIDAMIGEGVPLAQILGYIDRMRDTLSMYGVNPEELRSWAITRATGNASYVDNWQYDLR